MNGFNQLRRGAVAATLWGLIISSPPRAECQVARVTDVVGPQANANILRLGRTTWTTLFPNTFIFSGDVLRVGRPTFVKIRLEGSDRNGEIFLSTETGALSTIHRFASLTPGSRPIALANDAQVEMREEAGVLRVLLRAGALVVRLTREEVRRVRNFSVDLFDNVRHFFPRTRVLFLVDAVREQSVVFVDSGEVEIPLFSTTLTAGDLLHVHQGAAPVTYRVTGRFQQELADAVKPPTPGPNLLPRILGVVAGVALGTFIVLSIDGDAKPTTGGVKVGYPSHPQEP